MLNLPQHARGKACCFRPPTLPFRAMPLRTRDREEKNCAERFGRAMGDLRNPTRRTPCSRNTMPVKRWVAGSGMLFSGGVGG
eukprot:10502442-Alexandrium_andersonii.AAC.1